MGCGCRPAASSTATIPSCEATLLERPLELGAEGGVFDGDEPGEKLDDRDLRPERGIDRGELDADGARAKDDHRRGDRAQGERVIRVDDALPVERDTGQPAD